MMRSKRRTIDIKSLGALGQGYLVKLEGCHASDISTYLLFASVFISWLPLFHVDMVFLFGSYLDVANGSGRGTKLS